jgi:hypothetical protein
MVVLFREPSGVQPRPRVALETRDVVWKAVRGRTALQKHFAQD